MSVPFDQRDMRQPYGLYVHFRSWVVRWICGHSAPILAPPGRHDKMHFNLGSAREWMVAQPANMALNGGMSDRQNTKRAHLIHVSKPSRLRRSIQSSWPWHRSGIDRRRSCYCEATEKDPDRVSRVL